MGGLLRRLAGRDASPGHLPGEPLRDVAVLPDQDHLLLREKGQDADAAPQGQDGIRPLPAVRQLQGVLPDQHMGLLVQCSAPQPLPGL